MNELTVSYKPKGIQQWFPIVVASSSIIFGLYSCIIEAIANNYTFNFYMALAITILSALLILNYTVWQPKPIITINSECIATNIPNQSKLPIIEWSDISDLGIGISHISITSNESKRYNINLDIIQYKDLKTIKSKIIELCEEKKISYHND